MREIAKISTRKIVAIPKAQNFVLANNSDNEVVFVWTSVIGPADMCACMPVMMLAGGVTFEKQQPSALAKKCKLLGGCVMRQKE